eukprot:COSAG01_NODE_856_length_13082_cov_23.882009_4_plen_92_part_00
MRAARPAAACSVPHSSHLGLIGHLAQLAPSYKSCSHATRSTATHRERGRRSRTRVQARLGSLSCQCVCAAVRAQSTHIVSLVALPAGAPLT